MFIKCDEAELIEFFESPPIIIGDEEAGEYMYVKRQGDFKIIFIISIYEMYIRISIFYKENTIYSEKYRYVSQIKRVDINTLKIVSDNYNVIIIDYPQLGVLSNNE